MIERLVEGSLRKRAFVVIGVLFLVALGACPF
jgi:Cu/Ag efflux pump CusA